MADSRHSSGWWKRAFVLGALAALLPAERNTRPVARAPNAPPSHPQPALPAAPAPVPGAFRMPWACWKRVLLATYEKIGRDRMLAVAAGVVFYALLAIFPAIAAFVSLYGLFADSSTISSHLALLAGILPGGALDIVRDQVTRITANSGGGMSLTFVASFAVALWSANAGMKAIIDALNVVEGVPERRNVFALNAVSLALTLGAIVFLLLAIAVVVAFPLAMSALGLAEVIGALTWLVRWPGILVVVLFGLTVLYRLGPSRDRKAWRVLTPGVLVAAIMWLAGSAGLSLYLSKFADYNATYGSLGAAIGLMMWMWLSTIVILVGAAIDVEIERVRREGRAAP